ncbi:uncharacterized protein K452DRAFT_310382 [Aplosporella prunicola CBS 121167]|uniref:Uncharacterized protein n=1 Tax=Aplosporella prunicola CBS 121167 TaxID=1176127 RepID=A0A6A6B9I6_9PEZI|nr:uncharacterized protein K452DRAFT_310382 [Aplosporella prunicola CBS 121167]KAF2140033.1 hypothetical protein K452DRAFT_310382 [Aplosporella prunicola CBS 121167]
MSSADISRKRARTDEAIPSDASRADDDNLSRDQARKTTSRRIQVGQRQGKWKDGRAKWENDRAKWEDDRAKWEDDRAKWEGDRARWEDDRAEIGKDFDELAKSKSEMYNKWEREESRFNNYYGRLEIALLHIYREKLPSGKENQQHAPLKKEMTNAALEIPEFIHNLWLEDSGPGSRESRMWEGIQNRMKEIAESWKVYPGWKLIRRILCEVEQMCENANNPFFFIVKDTLPRAKTWRFADPRVAMGAWSVLVKLAGLTMNEGSVEEWATIMNAEPDKREWYELLDTKMHQTLSSAVKGPEFSKRYHPYSTPRENELKDLRQVAARWEDIGMQGFCKKTITRLGTFDRSASRKKSQASC